MPGIHHLELWVRDAGAAEPAWSWLLGRLGFVLDQVWPEGRSWSCGGAYLTLTESPNLSGDTHDRRRPGLNHVAFHGGTPDDVDVLMVEATEHGWTPLYADRYPRAGGPAHYAGWLEDVDGFKVEVVASGGAR
ncbi:VOC family protein [Isoptericola dokdonensis]|uniref:VOC domain-containing protein n=1 Tax=Isoptericola dokdonensis DS-3 TaxID=1300344 RepID=A0A161IM92_9MICO|nr:VOC family protein [Isoptericola dokdonensis]ANC31720.1 hypothetical protein I598_2179 [Isoptericola dokdonensis DS-3]